MEINFMTEKQKLWLQVGYSQFAQFGPMGLNVDKLSQMVGKSRSSFYHLFGNLNNYKSALMEYHWQQSLDLFEALDSAEALYPDFAKLLEDKRDWAFSHIQTFHHRDKDPLYQRMFNKVTEKTEFKIGRLWARTVNLEELPQEKIQKLYRIVREAVFSRLTYATYTAEILDQEIRQLNNSLAFLLSSPN